ncbi:MAG: hypothetical protein IPL35_14335 [Sphingobacteriales bacterium]|nr:hypothetical protein [Sphingobacteriales bacterium]
MKKYFTFCIIFLITVQVYSQHISNAKMLYDPRVNIFAVSGVGGGNLYEFTAEKSSSSGQISIDWNIALMGIKGRDERLQTLTTVFKYNPFIGANYVNEDSLDIRKIAFVDNEFQIMIGFRYNKLSLFGSEKLAKFVKSYFIDFSTAPYQIRNSPSNNTGFRNFNINIGGQFGYMTNLDFGLLGVTFNPQLNYIWIYDNENGDRGFEEIVNSITPLKRNFFGFGGKVIVYLNDFAIFFEGRKYLTSKSQPKINGLTDRAIFSIGGVATGNVFKNKTN